MTQPVWTPASRPGIVPLHPLSFGTILGRSFTALRGNPRVLLGFAIGVQLIAYIVLVVVVGLVAWGSFSRLDTLRPNTDEFDAVMTGSIALTAVAAFVLGLAASALSAIVQGIVVREVAHAVVAEKLTLGQLWRQFTPVAWRLVGYAFLLMFATIAIIALVAVGIFAIGSAALPVAVGLTVVLILAAIPLYFWLVTKLFLVPSVIVLERASIWRAIARSWQLTRGRFWVTLGVIVLISLVFGFLAQAVSIPFSVLTSGLTTIIAPTGDTDTGGILLLVISGLLTQVVAMLIQGIALVVQGTASALVYVDCRMRHEGLDLDLLQYVEQRDAGATGLPDPYTEGIGRLVAPRPAPGFVPGYGPGFVPGYAPMPGGAPSGPPHGGYPNPTYPATGYSTPPYAAAPPYPAQPYPAQPYPAAQAYPPAPQSAPPYATQPYPNPPHTVTQSYDPSQPAPQSSEPWVAYAPPQPYPAAGVPDPQAAAPAETPQAPQAPPTAPQTPAPTAWTAPGGAPPADPESPWR